MSRVPFAALDHVQLAMPRGREDDARRFYVALLGMNELPKPPELAKRGGCWFASGDDVREDDATDRPRAFIDDPFGNRIELISAV